LASQREWLAVAQSRRVAVVRGKGHGEGAECCGVLEGIDLAQPTEAAPGQLAEVERGQGLGVEQRAARFGRHPRE